MFSCVICKFATDYALKRAKKMIKKSEFAMDDEATCALLQRGDTDGIFFMESRYDKYNLQLLKPSCMAELTAACAMTHPLTCEKIYLYMRNKALGET